MAMAVDRAAAACPSVLDNLSVQLRGTPFRTGEGAATSTTAASGQQEVPKIAFSLNQKGKKAAAQRRWSSIRRGGSHVSRLWLQACKRMKMRTRCSCNTRVEPFFHAGPFHRPAPLRAFITAVIVLVCSFLLGTKAPSPLCSQDVLPASCLRADNSTKQVLIYLPAPRLEPFSHDLILFASLHL